jgi:peroxiredoxin
MNTAEQIELEEINVKSLLDELGHSTTDMFPVVIFGLPGAFTPTCTKSQVPQYEAACEDFDRLGYGVDCVSVNDSFVMEAWLRDKMQTKSIGYIPDGNGDFTRAIGMLVDKSNKGMGHRSWRYAMIVNEDGWIQKMFVEEGKGDNVEEDPYEVSKPENVLEYLRSIHVM